MILHLGVQADGFIFEQGMLCLGRQPEICGISHRSNVTNSPVHYLKAFRLRGQGKFGKASHDISVAHIFFFFFPPAGAEAEV